MKKLICILLAMLLVGCNQPIEPQEIPQESEKPVEEIVTKEEPTPEEIVPLKGEWSEELTTLLETINEEHRAVEPPEENEDYFGSAIPSTMTVADIHVPDMTKVFDASAELTTEQIKEDIDYLFEMFKFMYPLYQEMGGEAAFKEAKEAVLRDCALSEKLDGAYLEESLLKHLSFIRDGHFWINYKSKNERQYPFFFREVAFNKTENGYETMDGKVVVSVEGHNDLDHLFHRSLTKEGDVVYYPILLKGFVQENLQETDMTFHCEETLVVHYNDGSSQELIAEPFQLYMDMEAENLTIRNQNGISVFESNYMNENETRRLKEMLSPLADEPMAVFDVRSNGGGATKTAYLMLEYYSDQNVTGDIIEYTMQDEKGTYGVTTTYNTTNKFYENDNFLVVLSGKASSSSAEIFVNLASNMENVLIIGENTAGSLISSGGRIQLPNSHLRIGIGVAVAHLLPEGYFEEMRGIYPDLWVPAAEAEEAALNFIKKNIK